MACPDSIIKTNKSAYGASTPRFGAVVVLVTERSVNTHNVGTPKHRDCLWTAQTLQASAPCCVGLVTD